MRDKTASSRLNGERKSCTRRRSIRILPISAVSLTPFPGASSFSAASADLDALAFLLFFPRGGWGEGIDDAWSREMREQGLKHVSCDGDERRIFHEALPEEFDLNKFLSSTSPPRSPAAAQSGPVLEPETAATGAEALAADASEPNGRSGAADEAGLVVEESQASAPSTAEPATKPDEAQADSPADSAPATEATTPGEKEDAMALAAGDGGDGAPAGNVHGRPADGEPDGESWA